MRVYHMYCALPVALAGAAAFDHKIGISSYSGVFRPYVAF